MLVGIRCCSRNIYIYIYIRVAIACTTPNRAVLLLPDLPSLTNSQASISSLADLRMCAATPTALLETFSFPPKAFPQRQTSNSFFARLREEWSNQQVCCLK